MGLMKTKIDGEEILITGNFSEVKEFETEADFKKAMGGQLYDIEYKVLIPIKFKKSFLRYVSKSGKEYECTCKRMLECYQPWYGWDWYHGDEDCIFNRNRFLSKLITSQD